MPSPNFINPFLNPIFVISITRIAILFLSAFLVILILNRFQWKKVFHSNLGKIYIGWVILAPIYIVGIFLGRIPGLFVIFGFMGFAIKEITEISRLPKVYKFALLFLSFVSPILTSYFPNFFYSLPLLYFVVISLIAIMMNDSQRGFYHAAVSLFVAIWVIFGICHIILLSHLNNRIDSSRSLLLLIILAVSLSDIGAYIMGNTFRRLHLLDAYKIAPDISPNKTYIGVIGHILGAGLGIAILFFAIKHYLPLFQWVIIAIMIGVFAMIGGFTNSLFKRYYEVKDSNPLIPGHGGVLDRIDSLMRVVVILYYYFSFALL